MLRFRRKGSFSPAKGKRPNPKSLHHDVLDRHGRIQRAKAASKKEKKPKITNENKNGKKAAEKSPKEAIKEANQQEKEQEAKAKKARDAKVEKVEHNEVKQKADEVYQKQVEKAKREHDAAIKKGEEEIDERLKAHESSDSSPELHTDPGAASGAVPHAPKLDSHDANEKASKAEGREAAVVALKQEEKKGAAKIDAKAAASTARIAKHVKSIDEATRKATQTATAEIKDQAAKAVQKLNEALQPATVGLDEEEYEDDEDYEDGEGFDEEDYDMWLQTGESGSSRRLLERPNEDDWSEMTTGDVSVQQFVDTNDQSAYNGDQSAEESRTQDVDDTDGAFDQEEYETMENDSNALEEEEDSMDNEDEAVPAFMSVDQAMAKYNTKFLDCVDYKSQGRC